MNLLGDKNYRLALESGRQNIFDSFSRTVVAYRTPQKTILDTTNNFSFSYDNPDYSNDNTQDLVSYSGISGSFQACIQYDKDLEKLFASPTRNSKESLGIIKADGLVRMKISSGDYNTFFHEAIDIQFDYYDFQIFKTERPHGLFSPKYYTLYLKFKN